MDEIQTPEEYEKKRKYFEAIAEMTVKEREMKSSDNYVKAYMWSVFLPPIGLYYFIKYVFFKSSDVKAIKAGIVSLILTIVSFGVSLWLTAVLFQQVNSKFPSNGGSMQELTQPENQKKLIELLK